MKQCCQSGGFYAGPLHQMGGFYAGPRFQRGGAIRGFAGPEYQLGGKWNFGSFLWRHAKPLLSFLGKRALSTGVGIGQDVIEGKDFKDAAKERITQTGKDVAVQALDRVKRKIQTGQGRKRIKRTTRKRKGAVKSRPRKRTRRRVKQKPGKKKPVRRRSKTKTRRKSKARKKLSRLHTIFD